MTERVHTFGSHGGLVGIVTEPGGNEHRPGRPAVVLSNVGLNHRVGPSRLYVELARALAGLGFVSLRFDLSGFGDSEPRRSTDGDLERATLDTREAMDFLGEKKDITTFVLLGFCSGVDSAHVVALEDSRVVGVIFIDGYAYHNFGFWLRYCTIRNLQPARWHRFARQRLARLLGDGRSETGATLEVYVRESPTRERFASDVASLVARSVKMLFVYTVVADNHYNYRNQFHDTFGHRDKIDVEYFSHADHVFSTENHRAKLLSRLLRWMDNSFPQRESNSEAWPAARIHEG